MAFYANIIKKDGNNRLPGSDIRFMEMHKAL